MEGSAIGDVIPGDCGDDDVIEVETLGGFSDALRLISFKSEGLGGFHCTETASTRAAVSSNHEGGGTSGPAFPTIRTLRFFADGVELEIRDETFGGPEFWVTRKADFNPGRLFVLMECGVDLRHNAGGGGR